MPNGTRMGLLALLLVPVAAISISASDDYHLTTILPSNGTIDYAKLASFCDVAHVCANSEIPERFHSYDGCRCDRECGFYGDCCDDSPLWGPSEQLDIQFSCLRPLGSGRTFTMVASCSPQASDSERRLCEGPTQSNLLLGAIPISGNTSAHGFITYKNVYCALCNDFNHTQYQLWNVQASCRQKQDSRHLLHNMANFTWDNETEEWVSYIEGERVGCGLSVGHPSGFNTRLCSGRHIVDRCPVGWTYSQLTQLCKRYNAEGYARHAPDAPQYNSQYCYKCSAGNPEDAICDSDYRPRRGNKIMKLIPRKGAYVQPIIIIINTTRSHCDYGEIYDPFLQVCTVLLPPRARRGLNLTVLSQNNIKDGVNSSRIDHCTRYVLKPASFQLYADNTTVRVLKFERNFTVGQFRLTDDGHVEICREDVPTTLPDSFSLFISILTSFGLAVSIFFLLVHLCAVALLSELRNLSGMSLASLCLALLAAYVSFIAGSLLLDSQDEWCSHAAVLTYYFFMSAFLWMMVLAFEVSRLLRESMRNLRLLQGRHWKRFLCYASIAWGSPVLLAAGALYIESAPDGTVDDRFRPQFGLQHCWFGNPTSLLVFFAVPLSVIMVVNSAFFTFAAVVTSEKSAATGQRRNFRLYVKLTVMLGLTWIAGLLASVLDNNVLWVVFAVLNTLQGFFIFVMFTLTSKVLSGLARTFPCCEALHRAEKWEGHTLRHQATSKETSSTSSSKSKATQL